MSNLIYARTLRGKYYIYFYLIHINNNTYVFKLFSALLGLATFHS